MVAGRYTSALIAVSLLCLSRSTQMCFKTMFRTLGGSAVTFAAAGIVALGATSPCQAFGPVEIPLTITEYRTVDLCNGQKPIMPGQKAMEGLFPMCIEVDADAVNPKNIELRDVSVYGFVKDEEAGNSVLPNNPDFKSDAGQYAMIKLLPPGPSHIKYQFVAAVATDPKIQPLPKLSFFKNKAVSFPGGDRFKPLSDCEIDPAADGCDDVGDDA